MDCLHRFRTVPDEDSAPAFTDPFRYRPHPLVRAAAAEVMEMVPEEDFKQGKMLGVLVVKVPEDGSIGYLAAFSGSVNGRSIIDGFVPPIYDLLDPCGEFKKGERELNEINFRIRESENSQTLKELQDVLQTTKEQAEKEMSEAKIRIASAKTERESRRRESDDPAVLEALIRESQYEKAELRRLKAAWKLKIENISLQIEALTQNISSLKVLRAEKSERLQKWIFDQFVVRNVIGEEATVTEIFLGQGLTPPGGTGECAAPKLLQYARLHNLQPLAMGEFWFGQSPSGPVRTHGHFYPSCTSKCGPLLGFMLKGLETEDISRCADDPRIIYEDKEIIAAAKPSGMPSVPGLDGKNSLLEWLQNRYKEEIHIVHRLDMDTSGIIIYARTEAAAAHLRKQFQEHSVRKTYMARLSPADMDNRFAAGPCLPLTEGDSGVVSLALSPDYDERPRQKADPAQGKEAITGYKVTGTSPQGHTDIIFHPITGRTHQLRVHSAHTLGLSRPILGDLLYAGEPAARLCLHALEISFIHPGTETEVRFRTEELSYKV